MTMPTKEKTWTHRHTEINTGVSATDYKTAWYEIKCAFVAAGGTVVLSSDGTNAGAEDYWSSQSSTYIASTTYKAWCVIRFTSISGSIFDILLFDYVTSSTANFPQYKGIQYSVTGFSGGSNTTLPTATQSGNILYNSSSISYYLCPNNTSKKIAHSMWTSTGFRFFLMYNSLCVSMFGFEKAKVNASSYPTNEDYAVWGGWSSASTSQISPYSLMTAASSYCHNYSSSGAVERAMYWTAESFAGTMCSEGCSAANPLDGSSWGLWPIGLFCNDSTSYGYGRDMQLYDARWCYHGLAVGSTFPGDATKAWIHVGGGLVVPNDGTTWVIA